MNGHKAEHANIGMRLVVAGKATLTIGEKDLSITGLTPKTSRNSCAPFSPASDSQNSIPFYNILWIEHANGTVTIDYALNKSQTTLERKTQYFQTIPIDAAPAGQPDVETFVTAVMARAYGRAMRRKRIYVLINPNSGPGNSVRMFENEARTIFEAARMSVESVVLKRGGEATEIVEKVDIDKYDTIAAVSGDGTPYEIFNGLARRPDARRALAKIAVSHIPGGSGNANANTWNGTDYAGPGALAIVKGIITPIDLASITHGNKRTISVLSQAVGIMAEADLLTEDMRWLGNKRFEVGLVKRVFLKKCYPFDLAMKVEVEGKDNIKAFYKRHIETNGANAELDQVTVDGYAEGDKSEGLPTLRYGTINDELPQGWELVRHENIGNFFAGKESLVTATSSFWPAALPSDGCQDVITIEGTIPIWKAAQALIETETPKFFDNPNVQYRKVSAYRIIPHDRTGVISIDGESIPWEPFQMETHRALGRVLMKDGKFQHPGPKGWEKAQV